MAKRGGFPGGMGGFGGMNLGNLMKEAKKMQADLTKTQEDLLKIIKELTTQMEARFRDQFEKINQNLKQFD